MLADFVTNICAEWIPGFLVTCVCMCGKLVLHRLAYAKDDFLKSPQAKSTDGVIIATSHSSHYEIGMKAMGHFHILMEKPMTTDLTEADDLAKTALRCHKIFMLNNTANFRPSAEKVHDMAKSRCLKMPCVIERLLSQDFPSYPKNASRLPSPR